MRGILLRDEMQKNRTVCLRVCVCVLAYQQGLQLKKTEVVFIY